MRPFLRHWRLWLPVGLFLAALLGAAVVCLAAGRDPVSQATCDKIRVGMTPEELMVLVGRPPDARISASGSPVFFWVSEDGAELYVAIDADGRVFSKVFADLAPWEKLKRRLRSLYQRFFP